MLKCRSCLPVVLALAGYSFPAWAEQCLEDGDCAADEECQLDDVALPDCPPDQACEQPASDPMGWCYPRPVTCQADADCPEPTLCGDDGECLYVFEPCENDAMCASRYACTDIGGGGGCDSSGSSVDDAPPTLSGDGDPGAVSSDGAPPLASAGSDAGAASAATDLAATPPPLQEPPECQPPEPHLACFPNVEPCSEDSDCAGDWLCTDIPEGGPDGWADVSKACLPPGLVAVIDGRIQPEGSGQSDSSADGSSGSGDDLIGEEDVNSQPNDAVSLGTQGGSEGASGCSVGSDRALAPWSWLVSVLGLGGLLWRRRLAFTRWPTQGLSAAKVGASGAAKPKEG